MLTQAVSSLFLKNNFYKKSIKEFKVYGNVKTGLNTSNKGSIKIVYKLKHLKHSFFCLILSWIIIFNWIVIVYVNFYFLRLLNFLKFLSLFYYIHNSIYNFILFNTILISKCKNFIIILLKM